jgi:hypothetical protein
MEWIGRATPAFAALLLLAACSGGQPASLATAPSAAAPGTASGTPDSENLAGVAAPALAPARKFQKDRQSILAMAGNYHVTFNFVETASYKKGYTPKKPSKSGGNEVVRVIADTGDFISLQHLLVASTKDGPMVVKHWRQDWRYQPTRLFRYVGGNAWRMVDTKPQDVAGKWSQSVYQVDDSPRYAAVGEWTYTNGVAAWTPPHTWRPLARRDATTRDDYDVIDGVNRHVITPTGWVQEEDNEKLVLRGTPQVLVREIAYNVYTRSDDFDVKAADDYWAKTKGFWAVIRAAWTKMEQEENAFGLAVQGEAEDVYVPILEDADSVDLGQETTKEAAQKALEDVKRFTTADIGTLAERIAKRKPVPAKEGKAAGRSGD